MNNKTDKTDDENILSEIRPSIEEMIRRKKTNFLRALVWVTINLKKEQLVYASDLAKFLRIDTSYAMRILREMEQLGLLKSKEIGNSVEFYPVYEKGENDDVMVIENFFDFAMEKLKRRIIF